MSEFVRPLRLDAIGSAPATRAIEANEAERAALAKRFDLIALDRLEAALTAERLAGGIVVAGHVRGAGEQACVVSGLPVAFDIDEPLRLRFEPLTIDTDELELSDADLDVLALEGDTIDLGESAAQALGLALEPFPKADDAALAEARRLLVSEEQAARASNPFAALGRA